MTVIGWLWLALNIVSVPVAITWVIRDRRDNR